jgi:Protein of unknown function (DUF3047)
MFFEFYKYPHHYLHAPAKIRLVMLRRVLRALSIWIGSYYETLAYWVKIMRNFEWLIVLGLWLLLVTTPTSADEQSQSGLTVGSFSTGSLSGWKTKEFKGQTQYKVAKLDGSQVLKADSNAAASGLFYEQRIDLEKTPIMNWRWRIENRLGAIDEQTKSGDDFAARVYVVKSGGLVFWNTKAINYVWSSTSPKDKTWPNPFAGDHATMVAVRSSSDNIGTWYTEKRNIRADFKKLTGEDVLYIDAVAIMTDTDNAKGKATAYYGDIYFTSE